MSRPTGHSNYATTTCMSTSVGTGSVVQDALGEFDYY